MNLLSLWQQNMTGSAGSLELALLGRLKEKHMLFAKSSPQQHAHNTRHEPDVSRKEKRLD